MVGAGELTYRNSSEYSPDVAPTSRAKATPIWLTLARFHPRLLDEISIRTQITSERGAVCLPSMVSWTDVTMDTMRLLLTVATTWPGILMLIS